MPDTPSIGQMLRKHREERGLTPEQAAHQSRVPLRLLQALEADDYHLLPDPGYLTRLLHEYALLLKLDPKALEVEFRSAIRRPPGGGLVAAPAQPPPLVIPWKQVLWTAGVILIVTNIRKKRWERRAADLWKHVEWKKVVWVVFSLFLYAFLFSTIGYLLATVGEMAFLLRITRRSKMWIPEIAGALMIALASYFLFGVLMGIQLPKGLLDL